MNSDLKFYLELLKKRTPAMLVIFLLSAAVGFGLAVSLPPRFEANARLIVESATITDDTEETNDQSRADKQLQSIEQRLMTRANMIDVANKYRVFGDASDMLPDDIYEQMRELTDIRLLPGDRRRATLMTISFLAQTPEASADVVNELAAIVENESAVLRQGRVGETAEFFETEVRRLSEELSRKSADIVLFKEANKDALPEELQYRLERQTQIQERLNNIARELASQSEQRNRLLALGRATGTQGVELSPEQRRLSELRNELSSALAVFAETSPQVRVLRNQIERLEASMVPGGATTEGENSDPMQTMLDIQISEIDARIEFLKTDIERGEAELANLRAAIEKTPENAIRLEALERDYDNIQSQYNSNVASLGRAKAEESIVLQGKDERVRVIERAVPPNRPTSPNRKLVAGGGVFVGTALAAVFFVLTELLNRTIRRPLDLTRGLGVQPLATIPFIERETVLRRRRALGSVGVLLAVAAIPIMIWAIHTFYLPLDLLGERALEIIGL